MAQQYDVFISHCGKDCNQDFASILKRDLEHAGIRCFLDERDLQLGDEAVIAMLEAMNTAEYGIVILSEGFFSREWCMKELKTFVQRKNVVPVFLAIAPGDLKAILGNGPPVWKGFKRFPLTQQEYAHVVLAATNFTGARIEVGAGFWDTSLERLRSEMLRLLGKYEGGVQLFEEQRSTATSMSPQHPEDWTDAQRQMAVANCQEVEGLYSSKVSLEAQDAIIEFKRNCEHRRVHYADAFLSGDLSSEEYKKVDHARKFLGNFWKDVRRRYTANELATEDGDFFSPNKHWYKRGNNYRALVEPLDIANWYKCARHLSPSGHYVDKVPDGEHGMRPSQYAFLDLMSRNVLLNSRGPLPAHVQSLNKAKEYKQGAERGVLQIQSLADARSEPPRGFLMQRTSNFSEPDSTSPAGVASDEGTPAASIKDWTFATSTSTPPTTAGAASPTTQESPAYKAARILHKCTQLGGDGVADLSHLADLPGLAGLEWWLKRDGKGELKARISEHLLSLNLDGIKGIVKLPDLVASFTRLSSISLLGTRLEEFPRQLCTLTSLQSLAIGKHGPIFASKLQGCLPEQLKALRSLTQLTIRDVGLQKLDWPTEPQEKPPWPELRVLRVDDNQLSQLPAWLTELTLLEELDVSRNELQSLPEFERSGISLEQRVLPEAVGQESPFPLKTLFVQRNYLTELPLSLVNLCNTLVTLEANPQFDTDVPKKGKLRTLRMPPEEVLARPTKAVIAFLEALRENGKQSRTMMRVSFVGEAGVGKTFLSLALQGRLQQYRTDDPETVGIDTGTWVAKNEDSGKPPVYCRSWDFAGQPSYRAVHQFFFTAARSLYVLVLDLTEVLDLDKEALEREVMQRMIFWVRSLQARASGAIIKVVLSKADSLSREKCEKLLGMRETVRGCLKKLVDWSMDALRVEQDNLMAKKGAGEAAGEQRLKDLEAALALGGLKCPETFSDILVVGILPQASHGELEDDGIGPEGAEGELEGGSDESAWDEVPPVFDARPEPLPPAGAVFGGQPIESAPASEVPLGNLFETAAAFQAAIVDLAADDSFTIELPANWVRLIDWAEKEREVEEHATTGSISWEAYTKELCGMSKMFGSEESLREATLVLHDLGYLLYYGGDGELENHVFLRPQKVIDLLKVVVQHNFVAKVHYVASNNLLGFDMGGAKLFGELKDDFLKEGKLDHRMLPHLWPGIQDWGMCKALLELLERFDLAYSVDASSPEKDAWGSHGVPSRWLETPGQTLMEMLPLAAGSTVVSRRLHFDRLLPEGIFDQFLVRCLGLEGLALEGGAKALWRSTETWGSGACFECEDELCLLLLLIGTDSDQSGEIGAFGRQGGESPGNLFILGWDRMRDDTEPIGGGSTREAVSMVLAVLVSLLNTRFPGVRFEEEVICQEHSWGGDWSDDALAGAAGGTQNEADRLFRRVVASVRASRGWRSMKKRKKWLCGVCRKQHDISMYERLAVAAPIHTSADCGLTGVADGPDAGSGSSSLTLRKDSGVPADRGPDERTPASTSSGTSGTSAGTVADGGTLTSTSLGDNVVWQYDVFISHAGTVKELALELEKDLRGLSFTAFVDEKALDPGDDADRKMVDSVQRAPIGLVLLNTDFLERKWPLKELKLIVEADRLLPFVVGMSYDDFDQAWRASTMARSQLGDALFKKVSRTTFGVDLGGRQLPLRERICFSVLHVFVENCCPRLPDTSGSLRHVERALKAARLVKKRHLRSLDGADLEKAKRWVRYLSNLYDGHVPFGSPVPF